MDIVARITRTRSGFFAIAGVFLVAAIGLFLIGPERIVAAIGVEGGYLLVFITGIIGVSALTSGTFYASVVALASTGEFHPLLLGLAAAPGMLVSDILFYLLGSSGRTLFESETMRRYAERVRTLPPWSVPLVAYLYAGLTPLPQDVLVLAASLAGVPFSRLIPAIFLGHITLVTLIAYFVQNGSTLFFFG